LPSIFAADAYLLQFERLRKKARARHGQREPQSQGLTLSALEGHAQALCTRLAHDVRGGQFQFSALTRAETWVQGKRRTIHRAELVDALVLGALSQRLTALLEPLLADSVYAYRPGRGPLHAVGRVREYLAAHHEARPLPTDRGVFVLQRDLSAYGESIPTHATSQLWPLLHSVLSAHSDPAEAAVMRHLLQRACCPEVKLPSGQVTVMTHGLPTGSPIQQPLANLYLTPLDRAVTSNAGGLYARFGDDILLLEDDAVRAQDTARLLQRVISELELSFNSHKTRELYFTAPGRPFAGRSELEWKAASHVEYLGTRIAFNGRLGLKTKRLRELLTRTRWRVENTVALAPAEEARQCVAAAVGHALFGEVRSSEALSAALRSWVDDRAQLRQVDRALALMCAEALSGRRGVRALRHTRARDLRAAGLPSLLELRRRTRGPFE
jgi:Reverse transcriptase (RNA-dependent DNA polymerase)